MSVALDPDQTYSIVLRGDDGKPPDDQPTFIFRYMNSREWMALLRQMEAIGENGASESETLEQTYAAIKVPLVDWRNIRNGSDKPAPFAPDDLDLYTTPLDARELRWRIPESCMLEELELKKSASPSESNAENSAPAADTATPTPAGDA